MELGTRPSPLSVHLYSPIYFQPLCLFLRHFQVSEAHAENLVP